MRLHTTIWLGVDMVAIWDEVNLSKVRDQLACQEFELGHLRISIESSVFLMLSY